MLLVASLVLPDVAGYGARPVTPISPRSGRPAPVHLDPYYTDTQTRQDGAARRRPGEPEADFLRRVLPVSFPASHDLVAYQWRPGTLGKQLFFSVPGNGFNEYGTDLLVLDPYRPNTYAVRVLPLETLGDQTSLAAVFFADVDHDGRKELLALVECVLSEPDFADQEGKPHYRRVAHYQTYVYQLDGRDDAGRPQYRRDPTPRPYLKELPTAAAVRQALAARVDSFEAASSTR